MKLKAAKKALELIKDGMVVGLGSGTTAKLFIEELGKIVREGYDILAIPSSFDSHLLAVENGIPLTDLFQHPEVDIYIDGADQVDKDFNLIKGGGAALTREKILAYASKKFYVIVDETKLTEKLSMPIPIEVLPFAYGFVKRKIEEMGFQCELREAKGKLKPVISDNGNFIADVYAGVIENPKKLEKELKIVGVIENGIFPSEIVDGVIVGRKDTAEIILNY
uniref:Ribose-5-phosphate isomerase A n=1 Tax=Geoglobus ahangari TaxID=113653 RepID=A0A7C3UCN9_9EURY